MLRHSLFCCNPAVALSFWVIRLSDKSLLVSVVSYMPQGCLWTIGSTGQPKTFRPVIHLVTRRPRIHQRFISVLNMANTVALRKASYSWLPKAMNDKIGPKSITNQSITVPWHLNSFNNCRKPRHCHWWQRSSHWRGICHSHRQCLVRQFIIMTWRNYPDKQCLWQTRILCYFLWAPTIRVTSIRAKQLNKCTSLCSHWDNK